MTASLRFHGDAVAADGLLDFAVNVWPGARPRGLELALAAALASARYPDQAPARAALARRHGRDPGEILLGNGACDLFWLIAAAIRPRTTTCVHPSFTEPEAALVSVGAQVRHALRRPPAWRLESAEVPEDADIVVVGNPNNPTGTLDSAAAIVDLARPGRLLVVDESFMDFVPGESESLAAARDVPGLVVVRSVTKLWSLAAVRAGYLIAAPDVVARLDAHRQAWPVSASACAALEWCAGDTETPARVAAEVAGERAFLAAGLTRAGLRPYPAAANFLLVECDDADALAVSLRVRGIAVRPTGSFPALDGEHIRIAVRRRADNERLLEALGA